MQATPQRSGSITEFTAVILAGGCGGRLHPLTISCPKALLTVGNRPLLDFQLHHLYCSGFTRVLIVATKNVKDAINSFINRRSYRTASWWGQQNSGIGFHPELHWVDEETDSAFALMSISEHISSDIIVFPCDLITDVSLQHVADLHRIHGSTLTALVGHPIQPPPLPPGTKNKEPEDRGSIDVIAHDEATKSRLLFLSSAADCESEIAIPRRIMRRHPSIAITSRFLDSHVCVGLDSARLPLVVMLLCRYIMSRWVLDFLKTKEHCIDSIKDELVPLLVSRQSTKLRTRMGSSFGSTSFRADDSMDESQLQLSLLDGMLSEISCHVYIHNGVCSRAMNMPSFVRLNDAALSGDFAAACGGSPGTALNTGLHRCHAASSLTCAHPTSWSHTCCCCCSKDGSPEWNVPPTMMDKDKHNTKNLKKCVVGEGCSIDDSAKLTNCIVMRNVNIMANVVLEVTAAPLFLRVPHTPPAAELHPVRLRCCAT